MLEGWSSGVMGPEPVPTLQYSITPTVLVPYILREPFQWQRMSKPFSARQVVSRAADGGELQALIAHVVGKRNLAI